MERRVNRATDRKLGDLAIQARGLHLEWFRRRRVLGRLFASLHTVLPKEQPEILTPH